ncbi:MAG TPA: hypothetical protein VND93_31030 [Myxococcales bacterium]|jgi:hypothetical protein|nr:hypothetical protein [Myxococcales bacterium]
MRPVRLADLRGLVSQPDFQDWWGQLRAALESLAGAQARWQKALKDAALSELHAELAQKDAIDTLDRARDCDDVAATLSSEATDAENAAFQLVSQYEDVRIQVSEVWYRLGALEKSFDERQEATRKPGAGKRADEAVRTVARALQAAQLEYERLNTRKKEMWERVEATWVKQAETSLQMAEQRMRGKRVRTEAEARFQQAEQLKRDTGAARAEAEKASNEVSALRTQVARLLADAASRFECAAGEDFLYFRQKDHGSWAFCVSLVDDGDSYNLEVHPLGIYSVEQKRGVTFLEPARERAASADEGDRRFEEYFLSGRKGRAPAVGA